MRSRCGGARLSTSAHVWRHFNQLSVHNGYTCAGGAQLAGDGDPCRCVHTGLERASWSPLYTAITLKQ
jgi:hypothetical protein